MRVYRCMGKSREWPTFREKQVVFFAANVRQHLFQDVVRQSLCNSIDGPSMGSVKFCILVVTHNNVVKVSTRMSVQPESEEGRGRTQSKIQSGRFLVASFCLSNLLPG